MLEVLWTIGVLVRVLVAVDGPPFRIVVPRSQLFRCAIASKRAHRQSECRLSPVAEPKSIAAKPHGCNAVAPAVRTAHTGRQPGDFRCLRLDPTVFVRAVSTVTSRIAIQTGLLCIRSVVSLLTGTVSTVIRIA